MRKVRTPHRPPKLNPTEMWDFFMRIVFVKKNKLFNFEQLINLIMFFWNAYSLIKRFEAAELPSVTSII